MVGICPYCHNEFTSTLTAGFCGTVCAFKDLVMSQQIDNMEDLIKFVKELFKDEWDS